MNIRNLMQTLIRGNTILRTEPAGILGGESNAAIAGGINAILWHDLSAGICQLQVPFGHQRPLLISRAGCDQS